MPIFMDRHDISGHVTAETVAQMHQADLKIQDKFGCKGLTYWFDENRKIAFCLIDAPNSAAIRRMHQHAHGKVPNKIIEVDAGLVEAFLGRIQEPEKTPEEPFRVIRDSAFRVIMVICIKGIFPSPEEKEKWPDLFKKFEAKIKSSLHCHSGNMVKRSEGYYLISFTEASEALHAAMEIQSRSEQLKKDFQHIRIKIGLSAGNPVTDNPTVFEEAIKLAEWMCTMAREKIAVSPQVRELLEDVHSTALQPVKSVLFLTKEEEGFVMHFMNYMESCWNNDNLRVDNFSKQVHCSKSQLYRKMIALTGGSLLSFIKEYRLNEAVKLLAKKEDNISAIAFETGFSSPSYFSKCFHKKYGCMPSKLLSL